MLQGQCSVLRALLCTCLHRVVAFIHAAARCCCDSAEGSSTPRSACQHNTTLPAHVHDLDSFLSLASSEAQIMQLLLSSNRSNSHSGAVAGQAGNGTALQETAARRFQEQHLLDAVVSKAQGCSLSATSLGCFCTWLLLLPSPAEYPCSFGVCYT